MLFHSTLFTYLCRFVLIWRNCNSRSTLTEVFWKKAVLENFTNSQENISLSLIKVNALACNFIKKKLQYGCFPVNFAKFSIAPILKNICEWLLLQFVKSSHRIFCLFSKFELRDRCCSVNVAKVLRIDIYIEHLSITACTWDLYSVNIFRTPRPPFLLGVEPPIKFS